MDIYKKQKVFFKNAYKTGEHGWPTTEPTKDIVAYIKIAKKSIADKNNATALDVGCGEGRHSIVLARDGFKVNAIDLEPLAIKFAKKYATKSKVLNKIKFSTGNALNLHFPNRYFDIVVDCGCFHHILKKDWGRYFKNILTVLKDDGYFITTIFSTEFKHTDDEKPRKNKWLTHRGHYDRFFTKNDINATFGEYFHILKIKKEQGKNSKVFFHVLLQKI